MKKYFRSVKDNLSINDIWSLLIGVILIILCYIYTPTIGVENESTYATLKKIYNENKMIYTIAVNAMLWGATVIIYLVIKTKYIAKYRDYYYLDEMYAKYIEFLKGAKKIYIFSGDLDFLIENEEQFRLIKKMGSSCYILFNGIDRNYKNKELFERILRLSKAGVKIRKYNRNNQEITFRGQIRVDERGYKECLFIDKSKKGDIYKEIQISDQYITSVMENDFIEAYNKGENPFVSVILFDLGGVFFDGDFNEEFLKYLKEEHDINIKSTRNDKLLLDEKLVLGESTIIDWIENKIGNRLDKDKIAEIEDKWGKIWKPNKQMLGLVKKLKSNYLVTVASNLDKENSMVYLEKGYINCFHEPLFLSHEIKIAKPDQKFWEYIAGKLDVLPQQVLLIDDHEINIRKASDFGFNTVKFSIINQSFDSLVEELAARCIRL